MSIAARRDLIVEGIMELGLIMMKSIVALGIGFGSKLGMPRQL
jgi:hypothetical protein